MTTTAPVPDPQHASHSRSRVVRNLEDLLALAPAVLGFWPDHDIVMLTFGARRPFHGRLDLPPRALQTRRALQALTTKLLAPATEHHAQAVVLLFYSEDLRDARGAWPALRDACRRRGLQVVAALAAEPTRFQRMDGAGADPLQDYDVSNHPYVVQAIVEGRLEFASRAEMVASLATAPEGVARVEAALAVLPVELVPTEAEQVEVWSGIAAHVAARTMPDDHELARILVALTWSPPDPLILTDSDSRLADLQRRFWAGVLPRVPVSAVPTVGTLLGYASWRAGDGAMAWAAVDRVLEVDPGHQDAGQLGDLLDSATPPR